MNPEQTYHVAKDGQTLGPYSAETIQQYLTEGRLSGSDSLFNAETQEWVALSSVGFQAQDQPLPPPPPAHPPAEPFSNPAAPSGNFTDYNVVPLTQKAGFVNSLTGLAFLFWLLGDLVSPVVMLLAIPLLIVATVFFFRAPIYSKKKNPNGTLQILGLNYKLAPVALLAILLGLFAWAAAGELGEGNEGPEATKGPEAPALENNGTSVASTRPEGITSVEQAAQEVVGTWTYVGQGLGMPIWFKWVFRADGTMEKYTASPRANDWGQPEIRKWEAITDKYMNTGKRYYAIKIEGVLRAIVIKDSQTLQYSPAPNTSVLVPKGDTFPFSE